jgi:hypothetical protein
MTTQTAIRWSSEGIKSIKQERQEKEARKQARANRKRLPKRDPMTR